MLKRVQVILGMTPFWCAALLFHAALFGALALLYIASDTGRRRDVPISGLVKFQSTPEVSVKVRPGRGWDWWWGPAPLLKPRFWHKADEAPEEAIGHGNRSVPADHTTSPSIAGSQSAGLVDPITKEILRETNSNKMIVAWLLDSSGSLQKYRAAIADRLDRVYHELNELGVNKENGLLTAVVAVGERPQFVLEEPTADPDKIRQAYRSLVDDETGIENLFTAMYQTALKLYRAKVTTRRRLMFVVVTDEIGDDQEKANDTAKALQRYRIPVYVLGLTASFGRPVLYDRWQDPQTGFEFQIPIKRGPCTRREEVLRVPFVDTPYRSGLGPFALTRLARETGGRFFIHDDDRLTDTGHDTVVRY